MLFNIVPNNSDNNHKREYCSCNRINADAKKAQNWQQVNSCYRSRDNLDKYNSGQSMSGNIQHLLPSKPEPGQFHNNEEQSAGNNNEQEILKPGANIEKQGNAWQHQKQDSRQEPANASAIARNVLQLFPRNTLNSQETVLDCFLVNNH